MSADQETAREHVANALQLIQTPPPGVPVLRILRDVGRRLRLALALLDETPEPTAPDLCTVCHLVPVDVADGYDTCDSCMRRI